MPNLMSHPFAFIRRAALLGVALLATACGDRGPSAPPVAEPAPAPANAARLRCTVQVRAATLACQREGTPGAVRGVILGGQGINVRLASSGTAYDAGTETLRSDVTLENLTAQALGTSDGYQPAAEGVRVFFASGPDVSVGTGEVSVANADGMDAFTTSSQPYFQYDGILAPGDTTPSREWRFAVPATVTSFAFTVYVWARVPAERGWVKLTPLAPSLQVGGTLHLEHSLYTVAGSPAVDAPVVWTTADAAVVTVDSAGVLTGVGEGMATVTANSGARSGSVRVVVTAGTPPPTIVSFTLTPADVTANGADTVWAEVHVRSAVGTWQVPVVIARRPLGSFEQCFAGWVSGTSQDAIYRCPMVIADGASHGLWTGSVEATNPELRWVSVPELVAAGYPAQVSVHSPDEDLTPPVLTGATFSPTTARAGVDSVTLEVSYTDAGVGARQGGLGFFSSAAPNVIIGCSTTYRVTGTPGAGTFRCTFLVPAGTAPGTWEAFGQLIDANTNIGYTSAAEIQAVGGPTELTVTAP